MRDLRTTELVSVYGGGLCEIPTCVKKQTSCHRKQTSCRRVVKHTSCGRKNTSCRVVA